MWLSWLDIILCTERSGFDSQSGNIPRLWVWSWSGCLQGAPSWSSSLSLISIKTFFKKTTRKTLKQDGQQCWAKLAMATCHVETAPSATPNRTWSDTLCCYTMCSFPFIENTQQYKASTVTVHYPKEKNIKMDAMTQKQVFEHKCSCRRHATERLCHSFWEDSTGPEFTPFGHWDNTHFYVWGQHFTQKPFICP